MLSKYLAFFSFGALLFNGSLSFMYLNYYSTKARFNKFLSVDRLFLSSEASPSILALDFDGVICASSGESSVSSIVAAKSFWNIEALKGLRNDEEMVIKRIVSDLRPIIETGFENMLLVRYIAEKIKNEEIGNEINLDNWKEEMTSQLFQSWSPNFRDDLISKYGSDKRQLVKAFGETRDLMIKNDFSHWVNLNTLYPTVEETLKKLAPLEESSKNIKNVFIVTTKQGRFVRAILENSGIYLLNKGIENKKNIPETDKDINYDEYSNIFDLDNIFGSKINVLTELTKRYSKIDSKNPEKIIRPTIHFVEDRYETLVSLLNYIDSHEENTIDLKNVKLYLVDWGYNTEIQRKEADQNPNIQLINEKQFKELAFEVCKIY